MIQLDVTPYVSNDGDSDELRAYKQRVLAYAKKHSKDYHCGSLEYFARELDIKEEKPIRIQVETQMFEFEVRVLPSALHNKTEDEQLAALIAAIGDVRVSSGSGATGAFKLAPEQIVSVSITEPVPGQKAEAAAPFEDTETLIWRYTSKDGRVKHAWRVATGGDHRYYSGSVYALCGQSSWVSYLTDSSSRGEDRHCRTCWTAQTGQTQAAE